MIYFKKYEGKGFYDIKLTEGNESTLDSYLLDFSIKGNCELIYCENTDELVGILKYSCDDFSVNIDSIEIFLPYRRNGYAKHTITKLKSLYPEHIIVGQCDLYDSSKLFWESQGAVFSSCSDCLYYSMCGGSECLGVHCDSPNDYKFSIPARSKIQKHEICTIEHVYNNIPIIVVEFGASESEEYEYADELEDIENVIKNINDTFNNLSNLVYSTCVGLNTIEELKVGTQLPYYMDNNGIEFIEKIKSLNLTGFIQIAGIHRELCVSHVARIIKENIPNVEPLILVSDDYTVSAKASVEYGDTLERILAENNYSPRKI